MTGPQIDQSTLPAWHDEGMRAGAALDGAAAVLVVGRDPEVSAWVALGLARAQAAHRRVAVGDLVGEVAPLQALVREDDDAHGITDSFLYGVSLNRIARPVDDSGNLFVLPSGSEPVASAEILGSERWRRLAGGFREVGALLILVVPPDAPALEALAAMMDGVVFAGDAAGLLPDAPPPLAVVAPPTTRRRTAQPVAAAEAGDADEPPVAASAEGAAFAAAFAAANAQGAGEPQEAGAPSRATPATARDAPAMEPERAGPSDRTRWLVAGGALAVAAVAAYFYLDPATLGRSGSERPVLRPATTAPAAADSARAAAATPLPGTALDPARSDSTRVADSARAVAVARDSAARADSAVAAVPPVRPGETLPRLALANPADSARALAYTVYVQASNTPEGALLDTRTMTSLPPGALTPLLDRGAPWYRLLVGAYATRAEAERLLAELRAKKVLGEGSGSIVRAPYALRLAERVPASEAPRQVADLARKNVAAYLLSNGDGTVSVFTGAFETPTQAAFLARNLQAAGVRPTLVYRTGRSL